MSRFSELEPALLEAHEKRDSTRLIALYQEAGELALSEGDVDRGCFFLTHAYVFALEAGSPRAEKIKQILIVHGREE